MSHDHLLPPGVDAADADLLRRAYALETQDQGQVLYQEWAATYDRTMLDGLGYVSPRLLAERFAAAVPWRDRPVLDLGCGTGLVGVELGDHGFERIDGFDLSEPMMEQAGARGIYGHLLVGDLNQPLTIPDGAYGAAICNGTFTSGHVGAGCLDEILRIIEPGGVFACAIHHAVWRDLGFEAAFERLVGNGAMQIVEIVESVYYESSEATDGRLCIVRRAPQRA